MSILSRLKDRFVGKSTLLSPGGGWWPMIHEPFTGAWQKNRELHAGSSREFFAIYACITLIAADVSKLGLRVRRINSDGIWIDADIATIAPALRRPNRYQNHIQFRQWWMTSKLARGNAYALKERDRTGRVVALYILDPSRVTPAVAPDGAVYYQLSGDELNGVDGAITVPASEIIHDRYQPQFHPLVGISPIFAAALAGALGMRIQQESQRFFANGARPGGILTAPGAISQESADRLKKHWESNYTGENAGRIAVVGDGLKFEPMRATSVDSQLVEQLRLSADIVCSCFHVPPFKIGFGTLPAGKVQDFNLIYYADCLQVLIEEMELCLDNGLEIPEGARVELDTDDLLRMDTETQYKTLGEGVKGSLLAPNEARRKINQRPLEGGDSIYMQQQNYSLEALARRDALPDPFAPDGGVPQPENSGEAQARALAAFVEKELARAD